MIIFGWIAIGAVIISTIGYLVVVSWQLKQQGKKMLNDVKILGEHVDQFALDLELFRENLFHEVWPLLEELNNVTERLESEVLE